MKPFRKSAFIRNTGKPCEKHILDIAAIYAQQGVLDIAKVDPPTLVARGKIIFLRNPFLDFVGVWTERGHRALFLEAKSTEDPSLDFNMSGGFNARQFENMKRWHRAGAATGLLWECRGQMRFVSFAVLAGRAAEQRGQVHFHHGDPVRQGKGFLLFDFAANLRNAYPAAA